jgi:serine/threonine-protein kinase HipA
MTMPSPPITEELKAEAAYDLLNVNLVFPDDAHELALTLNGRKRKINKADFDIFAKGLNLPEKAVSNIYAKFAGANEKVEGVIQSSFLLEDSKQRYIEIWYNKAKILTN